MVKEIPLTQGKVALVDDADYEYLMQWKWSAAKGGRGWYAVTGHQTKHMPAFLIPAGKGFLHDHKDGNGLNNQRQNIRICTRAQNAQNAQTYAKKKYSAFKGVTLLKGDRKWQVCIRVNYKKIHLGYFESEIQAALAYDEAAKRYFGEFARTNFIEV